MEADDFRSDMSLVEYDFFDIDRCHFQDNARDFSKAKHNKRNSKMETRHLAPFEYFVTEELGRTG